MGTGRPMTRKGRIRERNAANPEKKRDISIVASGDEGDRTPGLGIANAALSQLSYIPTISM
jgi:hypothetical protein